MTRLVDAGLPLVTVYWIDPTPAGAGGGEFDSHGRIYHHMRQRLMSPLDRGLSALVADLAERGLLHDTLLVVLSEFGRTPRINAQAGRDHWPFAQTVLMAGAGITGGTIYGATDATGAYPTREPVSPEDLAQTVCTYSACRPTSCSLTVWGDLCRLRAALPSGPCASELAATLAVHGSWFRFF